MYPTYIPHGRWDDGRYASVEYTNGFYGFIPEYYIIVVSSYDKGITELTEALKHTKKQYKTAYIKYADVYYRGMH